MIEKEQKIGGEGRQTSEFAVPTSSSEAPDQAKRLRQAVQKAGGPSLISRTSGIPISTLHTYMNGAPMRIQAATALAKACEVSPAWLAFGMGGEEPVAPSPPVAPRLDYERMLTTLKWIEVTRRLRRRSFTDEQTASMLVEFYSILAEMDETPGGHEIDQATFDKIVDRLTAKHL